MPVVLLELELEELAVEEELGPFALLSYIKLREPDIFCQTDLLVSSLSVLNFYDCYQFFFCIEDVYYSVGPGVEFILAFKFSFKFFSG